MYNNTIRVSNSLDPDQARFFGRLDLGSNCYQQTPKSSRVKVWCSDISATDISDTDVSAWTFRPPSFRPRKMSKVDVSAITINFGFGMCACINV